MVIDVQKSKCDRDSVLQQEKGVGIHINKRNVVLRRIAACNCIVRCRTTNISAHSRIQKMATRVVRPQDERLYSCTGLVRATLVNVLLRLVGDRHPSEAHFDRRFKDIP